MKILYIVLFLVLAGCATTEEEKQERKEYNERAEAHYQYAKAYCNSKGLPMNVECDTGNTVCQKHPNSREKLTAYCVKWIDNRRRSSTTIGDRVWRDARRSAEIESRVQ